MNNATITASLPAIGTPFECGFFAGLFHLNGDTYALIVSPRAQGELEEAAWGPRGLDISARSYNDGLANTQAMAKAGSDLARWMIALEIGGFTDWYLPSRDELEILYRNLKPTTSSNYTWRAGDNPSSVPPGYPYTKEVPAQTAAADFLDDSDEALSPEWYWSSTQYSPYGAWIQNFDGGAQYYDHKDLECRARAVRRFKVTP
jgi:hypothetical protein